MFSFSILVKRWLRNNLKEVIASEKDSESMGVNGKYRQFRFRVDDIPFLSSSNSNAYSNQLSWTSKSNPFLTQTLILNSNVPNTDNESNDNPVQFSETLVLY